MSKHVLFMMIWVITLGVLNTGCKDDDDDNDSHYTDTDTATSKEVDVSDWSECPEGSTEYTTSSGMRHCCPKNAPLFCDETSDGYEGGCWQAEASCETILDCGGAWSACPEESLSYCDDNDQMLCISCPEGSAEYATKSGRPFCCSGEHPKFCNEMSNGYEGGCWGKEIGCNTITYCQDDWQACPKGMELICDEENSQFGCQ